MCCVIFVGLKYNVNVENRIYFTVRSHGNYEDILKYIENDTGIRILFEPLI